MIIGITTTLNEADGFQRVNVEYIESVAATGALPVLLSPVAGGIAANEALAEKALAAVDGLIISGGGDIHPRAYDPAADADAGDDLMGVDENRDAFELALARGAYERDLPTLGICRGMQIMNVALGGTLHRDLHACGVTAVGHRQEPPYERTTGSVTVAEGSLLACALGRAGLLPVNSMHHQAIDRLAPGLLVAARSDDRVIEAVEDPAHPFFLGIQWHPEYLASHRGLFHALADAAGSEAAVA